MRKYMGLLVGLLLLLVLAACGNKAAENVEETPGDPTGTVKVVTPQEEQTPEASDGAEQQPVSGDQKTLTQQETPQQEMPQQEKQNEQTGEQGQTSNGPFNKRKHNKSDEKRRVYYKHLARTADRYPKPDSGTEIR